MIKDFIVRELESFKVAFEGLFYMLKTEKHMRFHLLAMIGVISLNFILKVQIWEWVVTLFCIALVLISEALNTAIERVMDFVHLEKDPKVKVIKDVSASAVLIASIFAFVIAVIIYGGYLWN